MRIIALSTLKLFREENPEYLDAKEPILAWYRHALVADWGTPVDVKQDFLKMIWKLHEGLGIPAESLIKPPKAHV